MRNRNVRQDIRLLRLPHEYIYLLNHTGLQNVQDLRH